MFPAAFLIGIPVVGLESSGDYSHNGLRFGGDNRIERVEWERGDYHNSPSPPCLPIHARARLPKLT